MLEAPANRGCSTWEIMQQLTVWAEEVDSTLTSLIGTSAFIRLCPAAYRPAAAKLVVSRAIPRVLLTSCAALLHGFDTRADPLLDALIVFYSMEQVQIQIQSMSIWLTLVGTLKSL